jgi:hypothetical protein
MPGPPARAAHRGGRRRRRVSWHGASRALWLRDAKAGRIPAAGCWAGGGFRPRDVGPAAGPGGGLRPRESDRCASSCRANAWRHGRGCGDVAWAGRVGCPAPRAVRPGSRQRSRSAPRYSWHAYRQAIDDGKPALEAPQARPRAWPRPPAAFDSTLAGLERRHVKRGTNEAASKSSNRRLSGPEWDGHVSGGRAAGGPRPLHPVPTSANLTDRPPGHPRARTTPPMNLCCQFSTEHWCQDS